PRYARDDGFRIRTLLLGTAAVLLSWIPAAAQTPQNPSPMVETTRVHERIAKEVPPGERADLDALGEDIRIFLPAAFERAEDVALVVHYLGAAWLPEVAAARQGVPVAIVTVRSAEGPELEMILNEAARWLAPRRIASVHLTAFSAGYRGIRSVLRSPAADRVDGILLLDGLHASYVPERKVLAEGGAIDMTDIEPFIAFARRAVARERRMVIIHSTIFPGTFASTTETTDALVAALGLERTPVLEWGPRGMQQLSRVESGCLRILGFAGNSGPDHIDQFHAIPEMLAVLLSNCGSEATRAEGAPEGSRW
ncbi:MAG: hypothetical protein ACRD2J_06820, partial [Thermoanaerobaculia bacterium]